MQSAFPFVNEVNNYMSGIFIDLRTLIFEISSSTLVAEFRIFPIWLFLQLFIAHLNEIHYIEDD